jgi:hypothetical protein
MSSPTATGSAARGCRARAAEKHSPDGDEIDRTVCTLVSRFEILQFVATLLYTICDVMQIKRLRCCRFSVSAKVNRKRNLPIRF